jgi:hypothetical protein
VIAGSWRARHGIRTSSDPAWGRSSLRNSGLSSVRKGPEIRIDALSTAIMAMCGCRREGRSNGEMGWSGL